MSDQRPPAGKTDVLPHWMRTPAADRMGLAYADLSARNPGLIYRHVAGYDEAAINALTAAGGACAAEA